LEVVKALPEIARDYEQPVEIAIDVRNENGRRVLRVRLVLSVEGVH
jgi:hypothetical protein